MEQLYHRILLQVNQWGTQEWLLALVVVIGIGLVCMRGLSTGQKY